MCYNLLIITHQEKKAMKKDTYILIVDDDIQGGEILQDILSNENYKITIVENLALAKKNLKKRFYNIILADLKLPDGSGLDLLEMTKRISEDIIVLILTGYASLETSISAINKGAFAYIQKPLNIDQLKLIIKRAVKMQELSLDNKDLLEKLKLLSVKDSLTGLYNYRYLRERLSSEFKRAKRFSLSLSLIMLDIDYFKSINDIYGHQYGNNILKELAQFFKNFARENDIIVRYGGEEFIFILTDTNKKGALKVGKRLKRNMEKHVFDKNDRKIKIKATMGIVSFPEDKITEKDSLLDLVDQVLRYAKEVEKGNIYTLDMMNKKEVEEITNNGGKKNISKLKEKFLKMEERVNHSMLQSIYAFAKIIGAKDKYTDEQMENMVLISEQIGKNLNLPEKEMTNLKHAARLHILGKMGISEQLLNKKGKLCEDEYEQIKTTPQTGAEIIKSVYFLKEVVPIILSYREKFDGSGYPHQLKGTEIPLESRIISVVNVYQALISNRPYRKALSEKKALKIIEEASNSRFDPKIVKIFLKIIKSKNYKK